MNSLKIKQKMKTRLGITIGDSNGIGIEIILKTFKDNRMLDFCTPVIFGSNEILSQHKKILQIHNVNFNVVRDLKNLKHNKINLLEVLKNKADVKIGEKNKEEKVKLLEGEQAGGGSATSEAAALRRAA